MSGVSALKHGGWAGALTYFNRSRGHTYTYSVWYAHGRGNAPVSGGMLDLTRTVDRIQGPDLVVIGHHHERVAKRFTHFCVEGATVRPRDTIGIIAGCGLQGYPVQPDEDADAVTYSEIAGYRPTSIGWVTSRFRWVGHHHELEHDATV